MMSLGGWLTEHFHSQGPAQLCVGGFGKHPGWDDHIHDLDLDTVPLVIARQLLYVEGIAAATGEWDRLDPRERMEGFDHFFFWFAGSDLLVGRMWSSRDGKGRTLFPMVLCAHLSGQYPDAAIPVVAAGLQRIESRCRATLVAEEVRAAITDGAHRLLSDLHPLTDDGAEPARSQTEPISPRAWGLHLGASQEELYRSLYAIRSQMSGAGMATGDKFDSKFSQSQSLTQAVRLPADRDRLVGSVLFWRAVVARLSTAPRAPTLFAAPAGEGWVDVIAGKPGPRELFCLRALPARIPLASTIPYEMPADFREEMSRRLIAVE